MRRPIGLRPPRNLLHERLVHDGHRRGAVDEVARREQAAGDRACAPIASRKPVADRMSDGAGCGAAAGSSPIGSTAVGRGRWIKPRQHAAPLRPRSHRASTRAAATTLSRVSANRMRPSCAVRTWFFGSAGHLVDVRLRTPAPSSPRRSAAPPTARSRRPAARRRRVPKPPNAKPRPACSVLRRS